MAKQGKVLLARRHRDRTEGSVLLRSAESLGRVIGSLQRQLDEAAKRLAPVMNNTGNGASTTRPDGKAKRSKAEARKTSKSKSTGAKKNASSSGSRKTAGTRRSRRS
jgi:hypothetical protein